MGEAGVKTRLCFGEFSACQRSALEAGLTAQGPFVPGGAESRLAFEEVQRPDPLHEA